MEEVEIGDTFSDPLQRRALRRLAVDEPTLEMIFSIDGLVEEPFENLVVEVPPDRLGAVIEMCGARRAQMTQMQQRGDYVRGPSSRRIPTSPAAWPPNWPC